MRDIERAIRERHETESMRARAPPCLDEPPRRVGASKIY